MNHRMTATTALAALVALPLLAACGGGADAEPAPECIPVPEVGERIASGDFEHGDAYAVEAESGIYYVAMSFTLNGEEATGVWATDDLDQGLTLSVSATAKAATDWPDAAETFDITYPNDSTRAAESCIP